MSTVAGFITISPSGSDVHWKVPSNTVPVLILSSSRDERAHGSIFNHAASSLYLKFGGSAGMAVSGSGIWDVKITSASLYELPKPVTQGEIWGQWDSDVLSGFAMVLELGGSD